MDLIESYKEEMRLIRRPWTGVWIGLLLVTLILLPWFGREYWVYVATLIFIYSIGVQGQNILIGYTGQISFGQAGFLAIGAFTFGHLSRMGCPLVFNLLGAGVLAGLFWNLGWISFSPFKRALPGHCHLGFWYCRLSSLCQFRDPFRRKNGSFIAKTPSLPGFESDHHGLLFYSSLGLSFYPDLL
jgi:ABC-type branched-chain amino acid transport system, permease component